MSKNLHQLYYKKYFDGIDFRYLQGDNPKAPKDVVARIEGHNASLCASGLWEGIPCSEVVKKEDCFELEVIYPGLVTGIGINHEAKIEGEFKLGVHFDWTYGMPVIYGSSVKGVLRSALIAKTEKGKIVEYDDYFLKQATGKEWSQEEMEILVNDIFNGKSFVKEVENDGKKIREYQNKSIYERDIFFDAVVKTPDKKGRILCSDSITPHGENPLKNPTPLTFLKIAPGCTIEFRFKLTDSDFGGDKKLTAAQKKTLFEDILKTVGIGAKTNVGYGQLKDPKDAK